MNWSRRMRRELRTPPWGAFQARGVRWLHRRRGRGLLGDDMGLGKTYQTAAHCFFSPRPKLTLIVCPASVKYTWQREMRVHTGLRAQVLGGFKPYGLLLYAKPKRKRGVRRKRPARWRKCRRWFASPAVRAGWCRTHKRRIKIVRNLQRSYPKITRRFVVINYDVLADWMGVLAPLLRGGRIVMDECQLVKHPESIRAKACRALSRVCKEVIGLSGTPIENRPYEFWSILNMIAPKAFASRTRFGFDYCGPKMGYRGWEFKGASNIPKLRRVLRKYMLRRTKERVLKDLPTRTKTVVPVKCDLTEYRRVRDDFVAWLREVKGPAAARRARGAEAVVRLGALLQAAARAKLPAMRQWFKDWAAAGKPPKMVVFARHNAVREALEKMFGKAALVIAGKTPTKERHKIERLFQTKARYTKLVGNLKAAGVGFTFTAAPTVVHTEWAWVPGHHDQADDRIRRIGQKAKHVESFYFMAMGTVEETIAKVHAAKRGVVARLLDGKRGVAGVQAAVIAKLLEAVQ